MVNQGENQEQNKLNGYSDVEHGPMSEANRQCRDVICLGMFVTFVIGMIYISASAYSLGNISKIFRATDSNGVICGEPGGAASAYAYAYFYNPTTGDLKNRYCVSECPYFSSSGSLTTLSCYGQPNCGYDVTITSTGTYSTSPSSTSQIIGYQTTSVAGRVCIPSSTVFKGVFYQYISAFSSALSQSDFSLFATDIENNWKYLLIGLGITILLSFIFMYTLKCLAGLIVWTSLIGIILLFSAVGFVFFHNAGLLTEISSVTGYMNIPTVSGGTKTQYTVYGSISFVLGGIFLLFMVCCFGRIRLAVAVCKASGQFIAQTCSIVLVPIIQTVINIGQWAICIVAMLYLISVASFQSSSSSVFTELTSYDQDSLLRFYAFLFGSLWCSAIIQAVGIFVIASACCMWYYSHGPDQQISFPVFKSYKMVFRYHFGSLAFGSLILAIVQFLQLVVQAFKKQAQASGADQNKAMQYVVNCLRCCLACVERIVQFINKTAYIQIALRGKNFCTAAKDGFQLVWSNPVRYSIVGGIGQIIMFLGKLMIAGSATFIFYLMITYVSSINTNVLQPIYLLALVFLLSFVIAMFFMSIYSIAMDTILQCFIVDQANQKAKGGKGALYAPQQLAELMDSSQ